MLQTGPLRRRHEGQGVDRDDERADNEPDQRPYKLSYPEPNGAAHRGSDGRAFDGPDAVANRADGASFCIAVGVSEREPFSGTVEEPDREPNERAHRLSDSKPHHCAPDDRVPHPIAHAESYRRSNGRTDAADNYQDRGESHGGTGH